MPEQLLYAVVGRGSTVLAEFSLVRGNANLIALQILDKQDPKQNTKVAFAQEHHLFHVLVEDGLTFLCMAEEAAGRRIPFAFLEDVKGRFVGRYGSAQAQNAVAYEYNTEFSKVLEERLKFFATNPEADTISRLRGNVNEVKHIMQENIEKVLDRGERLELLVDKTDHLQSESFAFRRNARALKRHMWWQNWRMLAAIVGLCVFLLYVLVSLFCGIKLQCK